jgi:hypothetical protein
VTYNDTLLYEASTKEYTLLAGETMEVTEGWEKQNIQNWLSNIYKRMIIREGDFLPGEYKICMAAFTANAKHQPDKDKPIGSQCVNHTVVNYESGAVMEIKPKVPEKGRLTLEDLWNFTITNKSKYKQITEVYWMLKFNGQDMYEGYTKAFSVKPGETTDQSFKSRDIVVNHWFIEKMRDSILKTQVFPPGNYNLCLTVRSEWSKTEFGTGCIDAIVEEKK